jgi:hypothetical protein
MLDTLLWPGLLALSLGAAAAMLLARALRRSLRGIVIEVYRRLEAIQHELSALRAAIPPEAAALRAAVAGLQQPAAPPPQPLLPADSIAPLASALRLANFHRNDIALAHLAALRAASPEPPEISYGLSRTARGIAPLIIRRAREDLVVCSLALGEAYARTVLPALASQQYFAERRGLGYALLATPPAHLERPPAWMKIPLILNLLDQGFRRVLFIDADALVTDLGFDPDAVFPDAGGMGSITLAEDEGGVNTGVMFIEDGPATRRVLDLIWLNDSDIHNSTWEQHALKTLIETSGAVRRQVTIEPDARRFNSFPVERNRLYPTPASNTWHPGDFLCHFSGIRQPELGPLVERYATGIAPLPYYAGG